MGQQIPTWVTIPQRMLSITSGAKAIKCKVPKGVAGTIEEIQWWLENGTISTASNVITPKIGTTAITGGTITCTTATTINGGGTVKPTAAKTVTDKSII